MLNAIRDKSEAGKRLDRADGLWLLTAAPLLELGSVAHEARLFVHGHIGSGLHDPWALGLLVLLVVCLFRWPASYTAFAAVTLVLALSSRNLDSLERYALSAFPLVLAGATLTASGRVERGVLALSAAGMAGYATLAFLNAYVP